MAELGSVVGTKKSALTGAKPTPKPKRLTPKPDVLRELYLLSGNRCAMTGCDTVIIDDKGTVVGQVCHIESASTDGARFNSKQTDEQRRALANLVLICANHHLQIDSRKHEKEWTLPKVKALKAVHEAKFKAIPGSLQQQFQAQYKDNTDSLEPTDPGDFAKLERVISACALDEEDKPKRSKQVEEFISRMLNVPLKERTFMLLLIRRAIKLNDNRDGFVSVHVDDVKSALGYGHQAQKRLGASLERYRVGDVTDVSTPRGDEWHARVRSPSDYLTWFEISAFCDHEGIPLEDIVIHLKFGKLDA